MEEIAELRAEAEQLRAQARTHTDARTKQELLDLAEELERRVQKILRDSGE